MVHIKSFEIPLNCYSFDYTTDLETRINDFLRENNVDESQIISIAPRNNNCVFLSWRD